MAMKKRSKYRRLAIDDRMLIQACVHERMGISEIARRTGFSKSTISRELRNNSIRREGRGAPCAKRVNGLCNRCPTAQFCRREKLYYDFKAADARSRANRSAPRSSPKTPAESIRIIDEAVSAGVALGQSIHHIYASNASVRAVASERTVRRLCYRGLLSAKAHQLRRYVRYKRPSPGQPRDVRLRDIRALVGRTYRDYLKARKADPRANVAQYDSVIGKASDRKALLTVTFPKYSFQFGFVVEKGSASSVLSRLRGLFAKLGDGMVRAAFPINLADNGTEFSSFHRIELSEGGEKLCSAYFTSPYKATDKAECERLHELVRYCLPKGHSLDSLTQEEVDDMYSNINSYVRKSKRDQTPYDMVRRKFGEGFLLKIGIRRVPKKKVRLIPII